MLVLLMRHGIAVEPGDPAFPIDHDRPLSPQGRKRTIAAVRGMRKLGMRPDVVITSPLRRARQTAEIVAAEFGIPGGQMIESATLTPDAAPEQVIRELHGQTADATVLLIGHEPHLSSLASLLLIGDTNGLYIVFKKAAVCGVEWASDDGQQQGTLRFLLQPRHLRSSNDED